MAGTEDAATVLEQWIHDVANLPAEITHLYEEAQAKEVQIQECRLSIRQRDDSLQRFMKMHGVLVPNPKEEDYNKAILDSYERAQVLQEEKIGLVEKAMTLMDRQVKKMDIKLRDLVSEGSLPADPMMPSLLRDSPGNMVAPSSVGNTGANTPLHPVSGNQGGGAANLAQAAAIARITNAVGTNSPRMNPGVAQAQAQARQARLSQQRAPSAHAHGAMQAAPVPRAERESSASSDSKRRRPTASLGPLPQPLSGLARPSSMGPGTPKPATPLSRAGSVGPRQPQRGPLTVKKAKPQQPLRKMAVTSASKSGGVPKLKRRKGGSRASPSTTADDESAASEGGSDDEDMPGVTGPEGEDESDDNKRYCFCQSVSYGDMVACDNEHCQFQWFHWDCVNIRSEPVGDWLCPECRKQPSTKIKKSR